jgi:hypothetical protein
MLQKADRAFDLRMSKPSVWENYHRFEEREYALASAQVISKLLRALSSLLLPEKKWNG